ncbi:MAG: ATP-binding protein, partial [Clostridia bacterium]|nr:ATP-binding protein [Clostridia bacterium]
NMPQVDNIDFAIIIGNLLDNAIEATAKIKEPKSKTIEVFIEATNHHVLISITNPVDKDINVHQIDTTKKDQKNHGFGLLSVRKIVDRYKGSFILKCQDGIFEASVMLPQKNSI